MRGDYWDLIDMLLFASSQSLGLEGPLHPLDVGCSITPTRPTLTSSEMYGDASVQVLMFDEPTLLT